jgi:ribose 5-phosphate isomerase A
MNKEKNSAFDQNASKKAAGNKAAEYVKNGMVVGLGTGSTVKYFIEKLAEKSLDISCIPTSIASEELAVSLGLKITNLKEHPVVDVDVDGADEVDAKFNLIKGGGGALTREKIVAEASKYFIVVADESKMVHRLGKFPVAVEVLSFAEGSAAKRIKELGGLAKKREGFITDSGNIILDCKFNITDPRKLETALKNIPGVVENGIFSRRKPEKVIVGKETRIEILERE